MNPTDSIRPPAQRRFTSLQSVRLATAETVRRVDRGEYPPEKGRVLLDGYRLIAELIRETRPAA